MAWAPVRVNQFARGTPCVQYSARCEGDMGAKAFLSPHDLSTFRIDDAGLPPKRKLDHVSCVLSFSFVVEIELGDDAAAAGTGVVALRCVALRCDGRRGKCVCSIGSSAPVTGGGGGGGVVALTFSQPPRQAAPRATYNAASRLPASRFPPTGQPTHARTAGLSWQCDKSHSSPFLQRRTAPFGSARGKNEKKKKKKKKGAAKICRAVPQPPDTMR
ncbi:hypothetical protein IWX46DRAFT_158059 [Phyllosticta citricarpa]|uniref:Uncharacterized protein n=1 Tax=Phyllosticta citricarpa TaxID=55181 RepID=A0ABR1M7U5_9PEZI